jgi:hypothetical protein
MTRSLLLPVYGPEWNVVDAAVVELSRELLTTILERSALAAEAKARDPNLYALVFWDYEPTWVVAPGNWYEFDFYEEPKVVEGGLGEFEAERVCVEQMTVTEGNVYWSCSPKHTADTLETETIPIDRVREWLATYYPAGEKTTTNTPTH